MTESLAAIDQLSSVVTGVAHWIRVALEGAGVVIIGIGAVIAIAQLLSAALRRVSVSFTAVRLSFARYLVLALELQLGADIIATGVAPEWHEIGELAAIAAIRTALNYFLSREIAEERTYTRERTHDPGPSAISAPAPEPQSTS